MSCNDTCRPMLTSMRRVLRGEKIDIDAKARGMYVDGPSGFKSRYYWVRNSQGAVIWEGSACCKWAARYYGLLRLADREE
jgi:hypothetical protein